MHIIIMFYKQFKDIISVCVCVCRGLCCDQRNGRREVWERLIDSSAGQLALTEVRNYNLRYFVLFPFFLYFSYF